MARANGITAALAAPTGGLVSGQSALIRLAGTTPDALTVKAPVALHVVYPSGGPAPDPARLAEEPEPKTFEERAEGDEEEPGEARCERLRNLLEEARAYGAALEASRAGRIDPPRPDVTLEALAPFAGRGAGGHPGRRRGRHPRRRSRFAEERGLKLIVAGGLEAWRCADLLEAEGRAGAAQGRPPAPTGNRIPTTLPSRTRPALHEAGVRFAIVSDDAAHVPQPALRGGDGARLRPARGRRAARHHALPGRDLRRGRPPGLDRARARTRTSCVATGDIMDHRTVVTHVFIDGVAQSLETRHTRLFERFKDRP